MIYFRVTITVGNPRLLETATIARITGGIARGHAETETTLRIIFHEPLTV